MDNAKPSAYSTGPRLSLPTVSQALWKVVQQTGRVSDFRRTVNVVRSPIPISSVLQAYGQRARSKVIEEFGISVNDSNYASSVIEAWWGFLSAAENTPLGAGIDSARLISEFRVLNFVIGDDMVWHLDDKTTFEYGIIDIDEVESVSIDTPSTTTTGTPTSTSTMYTALETVPPSVPAMDPSPPPTLSSPISMATPTTFLATFAASDDRSPLSAVKTPSPIEYLNTPFPEENEVEATIEQCIQDLFSIAKPVTDVVAKNLQSSILREIATKAKGDIVLAVDLLEEYDCP